MRYLSLNRYVCMLVAVILMAACGAGSHPPDEVLIERFNSHQADFEKLVTMLNEDPKLRRLTLERAYLDPGGAPLPKARMAEYSRLLKLLHLQDGVTRDYQGLHLIASHRGGVVPNSGKSYSYTLKEPSPLVDSLDAVIRQNSADQRLIWRRIAGNWYLSYEKW